VQRKTTIFINEHKRYVAPSSPNFIECFEVKELKYICGYTDPTVKKHHDWLYSFVYKKVLLPYTIQGNWKKKLDKHARFLRYFVFEEDT